MFVQSAGFCLELTFSDSLTTADRKLLMTAEMRHGQRVFTHYLNGFKSANLNLFLCSSKHEHHGLLLNKF